MSLEPLPTIYLVLKSPIDCSERKNIAQYRIKKLLFSARKVDRVTCGKNRISQPIVIIRLYHGTMD